MLIDTHCHLDFADFDHDRDEVIKRAEEKGVTRIINVVSSISGSERSLELSSKYPNVYAVVGIHPHEADSLDSHTQEVLRGLAKNKKTVAIGEIGLDYFKNYSRKDNQLRLFSFQLSLAKELNLPVVIHTRSAAKETLEILKEAMPLRALVHCFSGDREFLDECLSLGFFVSFTCNITYKKADNLREMLKLTPLNRLMLETDAPYLSLEGSRGKRNEPMQVAALAEFVAGLKALSLEEVAKQTTDNAVKFFGLS
ncbi:MAG: TatD family hydrolase [Candidatus Omnitrophica bacterium]|nr:TatD family hydrolase [Candidatus Omnitrophota bacterium]